MIFFAFVFRQILFVDPVKSPPYFAIGFTLKPIIYSNVKLFETIGTIDATGVAIRGQIFPTGFTGLAKDGL